MVGLMEKKKKERQEGRKRERAKEILEAVKK